MTTTMHDGIAPFSEKWGITQVNVESFNYTWTINNFIVCKEVIGHELLSPIFSSGFGDKLKWQLTLYPRGKSEQTKDKIMLFLTLIEASDKSEVHAKFKFSLLNAKRERLHMHNSIQCIFAKNNQGWGTNKLVDRNDLLNKDKPQLLPEGKLTIFCEVLVVGDSTNINGHIVKVPECRLTEELGELLDSERFFDVTLVTGDRELRAHRAVLASRSTVFAAMFKHELEEQTSGRIRITDMEPDVLAELLRFVYTGCAPHLNEMADLLLVAADKYALDRLKAMCEKVLAGSLTVQTAAATLVLADRHSAKQLKAQTIDFIVMNRLAPVMATDGWKDLVSSHLQLSVEVLGALAVKQPMQSHTAQQ